MLNNQNLPCRRRAIFKQRAEEELNLISRPTIDACDVLAKSHVITIEKLKPELKTKRRKVR